MFAKNRFTAVHTRAKKQATKQLSVFKEWRKSQDKDRPELVKFMKEVDRNFVKQYPEVGDILQACMFFFFFLPRSHMSGTITDPSKPDNPIVFVNRAFVTMTGYKRSEIVGYKRKLQKA